MTEPSNKHMVFIVHDGHVKFEANFAQWDKFTLLSGSEPLVWYGVETGERISEVSAEDMIDHLISVFKPTTSETLWEQSNDDRNQVIRESSTVSDEFNTLRAY